MIKSHLWCALGATVFTLVTVSANAALISRLGGQAVYDDVLNITWVANAALSGTNTWANQVAWASNLDYLGFDDWRLASVDVDASGLPDSCATELACRDNELLYLFSQYGVSAATPGLFMGVQPGLYWSSNTHFNGFPTAAWAVNFDVGGQSGWTKNSWSYSALAVRSGDVLSAPIPAAVWLFSSGLLGLVGMTRRKKA